MSKKRAFVRYSKQGKVVPGSLILTGGSFPKGPSTWKEVPADLCCDTNDKCNLPPVTISAVATGFPYDTPGCKPYVGFKCDGIMIWQIDNAGVPIPASLEDYIYSVSINYSWVGTWSTDGTNVTLEMNGNLAAAICPTGVITMVVSILCPA